MFEIDLNNRLPVEKTGFSLRASVVNVCNMTCIYCPRYTSMENYTPQKFRDRGLSNSDYIKIFLNLLKAVNFSSVSLTGGEPLINKDLTKIAEEIHPLTKRLELTTNGLLLTETKWKKLKSYFDRVKISLDTLDSKLFRFMTGINGKKSLHKVLDAVQLVLDSGVEVAINCVVSKSNMDKITDLLEWVSTKENLRLHLLDFYYTDERREIWEKEFIPLDYIISELMGRNIEKKIEPVFGCRFYSFPLNNGSVVRFKVSSSGTMRSQRCQSCKHYCQEGIYGLKLSTDGWVTTCPSNFQEDGVLLDPDMSPEMILDRLSWLLNDIQNSIYVPDSFDHLLKLNNLKLPEIKLFE